MARSSAGEHTTKHHVTKSAQSESSHIEILPGGKRSKHKNIFNGGNVVDRHINSRWKIKEHSCNLSNNNYQVNKRNFSIKKPIDVFRPSGFASMKP